ncbi:unnamed protein product, partial [Echinostoma caproni]|uniref:LIM zinc-binding domain-containing protein n=1 Tax=Echinostoma caproni TaxID=27848 RepID=A0A183A2Q9_9TREM
TTDFRFLRSINPPTGKAVGDVKRPEYPKSHPASMDTDQQPPPPLVFHVSCFTCCVCQQPLAAGDPYTIDPRSNRPICRTDYLSSRDTSEASAPRSDSSVSRRRVRPDRPTSKMPDRPNPSPVGRTSEISIPMESHYDPGNTNSLTCHSNKRIRTSLTDEQRLHLQKAFEVNPRPPKPVSHEVQKKYMEMGKIENTENECINEKKSWITLHIHNIKILSSVFPPLPPGPVISVYLLVRPLFGLLWYPILPVFLSAQKPLLRTFTRLSRKLFSFSLLTIIML